MEKDKVIDHSVRKHAKLSASGASKWMNCTPSVVLEEQFEDTTSSYAQEGTLAHEFAELELRKSQGLISDKDYNEQIEIHRKNPLYYDGMQEESQIYVDYVLEQFAEARKRTPDAVLLIEKKIDLTHFIEDGFGTGDACIIADGILDITDLKFGKGVRVSAFDNRQLKLYGLGALREFELSYDIHTVRLTISQPRLDHVSTFEISAEELNDWGHGEVKEKAELAFLGLGEQVPGEWCRFCKAKPVCKALKEQSLKIAQHEFADPYLLTEEELLEVYRVIPQTQDWMASIESYFLSEALKGKKWKGYKLVEGRANRALVDKDKVEETLLAAGFTSDQIMKSDLQGIGALEKVVGKVRFAELLKDYIVKPQGKPSLVDESDKREEYSLSTAQKDFE